jgi:uncharacterized protein (TIGR02147 family)
MLNIFEFKSPSAYFAAMVELKKQKNPLFSLRAAAKQIGTAPSTLSFFINGKKKLSIETGRKISSWLKLNSKQEDYFLKLIELENSTDDLVKEKLNFSLSKSRPVVEQRNKKHDYKILDDWRNVVLMAIFMSPELRKKELREIAVMLNEPYSDIEAAYQSLVKDEIITEREDSSYQTVSGLIFDSSSPQKELRNFHKTMLNKASIAIEDQPNTEKYIGSETFGFDEKNLDQAKELIDDFMTRMVDLNQKSQKNKIYHLGVQFFKLTK